MTITACGDEYTDETKEQLDEAAKGYDSRIFQEVWGEVFEKEMPQVERVLQEKAAEIAKLETPREERAMKLIHSSASESREYSTHGKSEDVEIYKALGVCPTEVKNFQTSWTGSNENVIKILDKLPQIGHLAFEEIRHTGEPAITRDSEGAVGVVAGEATPEKSGRVPIRINEHHPDDFTDDYPELERATPQEREQMMKQIEAETIVHEYAEGVWRELTTLEERSHWRHLHFQTLRDKGKFVSRIASESSKEDFCECCAKFITEPEKLRQANEGKYNFVRDFFSQLEKESQWIAEQISESEEG